MKSLAWRSLVNFRKHSCLDRSAAVAFYSLLSLVPLLYLVAGTLNLFYADGDGLLLAINRLSPFLPAEAASALKKLAPGIRTSGGLTALAFPALIWVASSALSALEHAVNVVFGTIEDRGRRWRSRARAVSLLGFGLFLLALTLVANTLLLGIMRYFPESLPVPTLPVRLAAAASYLALLVSSLLIFGLFYKWLPRTRVRWRAAGSGALLAVLLWEAIRRLFGGLLLRSPAFGLLTGTMAGIVTIMLWIYAAAVIVLLGAEFAALVHRRLSESAAA
jgi:membrane protein